MNAEQKISKLESIKSEIKILADQKTALETELAEEFKSEFDAQLFGKDYNCGTVIVPFNSIGDKLKFVIAKKVDWDQKILRDIYMNVLPSWGDPAEYVDVSYNISETKYKAWPTPISSLFAAARTVKPSKPSLVIERAIEKEAA